MPKFTSQPQSAENAESSASFPKGIQVWFDPIDAALDIVFIHGLTGDRSRTWTHPNCSQPWPQAFLPTRLPQARLLTFGYDAYIVRPHDAVAVNCIANHAQDLINALAAFRQPRHVQKRPIIFIAHSLGGLVCKDGLLASQNSPDSHLRDIFLSTSAIAFLATPHSGSVFANWAKIPAKVLGVLKHTNSSLLTLLETDSEVLVRIQKDFLNMLRSQESQNRPISITCFYESLPLAHGVGVIVPAGSAILQGYNHISVHANHRDIARFSSAGEDGFVSILYELQRWVSSLSGLERFDRQLSEMEKKCLASLAFDGMSERYFSIEKPANGTCEWLFDNPLYQAWIHRQQLNKSHGLLWIKGKPGSGKSTIMKHVYDQNRLEQKPTGTIRLCFFFNARGTSIERSTLGLYRTILYQLLIQHNALFPEALLLYRENTLQTGTEQAIWHVSELREFIPRCIVRPGNPPLEIYVDALDECNESEVRQLVHSFEDLAAEALSSGTDLKICWSSRHYPHISVNLGFELHMEAQNDDDIAKHVGHELRKFKLINFGPEFEAEFIAKASGVFLWVDLVLQRILKAAGGGRSREELIEDLHRIPNELNELFEEIWVSLDPNFRSDTLFVTQLLLFSYRPMTVEEFQVSLTFGSKSPPRSIAELEDRLGQWNDGFESPSSITSRFKRYITHVSGGLFEVSESHAGGEDHVQVIHETVRDFFLGNTAFQIYKMGSRDAFVNEAHGTLRSTLSRYLAIPEYRTILPGNLSGVLSQEQTDQGPGLQNTKEIVRNPYQSWLEKVIRKWQPDSRWLRHSLMVYTANYLFAHAEASRNPSEEEKIELKRSFGQWMFLILNGHCTRSEAYSCATSWIIRQGILTQADINRENNCITALHTCVLFLLETKVLTLEKIGPFALGAAAHDGMDELIENLLDGGIAVDSQDLSMQTALHEAAARGHWTTVVLLLSRGAGIEARNMEQDTPLILAARAGNTSIVVTLLKKGANVHAENIQKKTALGEAISMGNVQLVELLLDKSFRMLDDALIWAAESGQTSLVKLILGRGADVNFVTKDGFSALYFSAKVMDTESTDLLLRAGASMSPMQEASLPYKGRALVRETAAKILIGAESPVG